MLGDGVAIQPEDNFVYAPIDGEITLVYDAKHAIAIKSPEGLSVMIHLGLDTVKLEGRGFASYVKVGDKVKAGDKILFFDREYVELKSSTTTPLVITNSEVIESMEVDYHASKAGQNFMSITLK